MGLVERAQQIATTAHEGQVDKAGAPYIGHPARVAARVRGDAVAEMVAWLHDVVEDTDVTLDDLRAEFPPEVVEAVDAVTYRDDSPRDAYYERIAANPLAKKVKLADIADNTDPARQAALDEPTRIRLTEKYAKARAALGET